MFAAISLGGGQEGLGMDEVAVAAFISALLFLAGALWLMSACRRDELDFETVGVGVFLWLLSTAAAAFAVVLSG